MIDAGVQTQIDIAQLAIRPRFVAKGWVLRIPGEDGIGVMDRASLRMIHSIARELDGEVWAHVSVSRRDKSMPDWLQVRNVWRTAYPAVKGVIVVPVEDEHVNIAEVGHVWGCLSTPVAIPDFTRGGKSI